MRARHLLLSVLIVYVFSVCTCAIKPIAIKGNENLAIVDVNVIPMDKELVLPNCTVLIEDGVIKSISNNNKQVPKGYKIINATGKYLMPGLCDMHIHLRSLDEFHSFLRHGVTTVLHMSGPTQSAPDLFAYRDSILNCKLIAPNLYFTSKCVEGERMNFPAVSESISTEEQAEKFIEDAVARKYDFIKMYETIDSSLYFYFMGRAKESKISVIGHTPRNVNPTRMLEAGQVMIAHGEEFFFDYFDCRDCGIQKKPDESRFPLLIELLKKGGIYVTPNLSFVKATQQALEHFSSFQTDPEFKYLSKELIQVWKNSNPSRRQDIEKFKEREIVKYSFVQKLTRKLNEAGIPLLAGTDCSLAGLFPGKSLHMDLIEMKKAGLSNYECLKTATSNPGEFINKYATTGRNEQFGKVKEGFRADLILLDANPLVNLDSLTTISAVFIRGKYYDSKILKARQNVYNLKLD